MAFAHSLIPSDSERCLLLAAAHSSPNAGGQRRVDGVSHCSQGAQRLSSSKAASDHPSGAHHSQLMQGHTLCGLFTMCYCCSGGGKNPETQWKQVADAAVALSLCFVHITAKKKKERIIPG